ncbi:leucine-rich repeat protein [Artemisia annua]|uniref:Leucine-rich repeat protein n=1 Tax=Artemisia annua TaxID=35608 RepID=A0A2U1PER1_ARTAN|nr:leucine-rich repeat protein [Artemisia annua]
MISKWLIIFNRQAIRYLFFIFVQIAAFSTVIHTKDGDRVALLTIKSMINGESQGVMSSWNDSSPFCQWKGITCDSRNQRVTVLNLSSEGLIGSLSPSIGNLSFLKVIRLHNNSLSGEIPPQVSRLIRLRELRLYNNSFNGKIPAGLANCSNLEVLHMGYNNLVGMIPDEFGSLSMLKTLIFHENKLEGGIPRFIGNLTFLETLSLANCGLRGRIPDVFHQLSNLRRIALLGNNLVGTVPRSFYNLSSLEQVFLDNNRLTGRLPINVGLMQPRLNVFSLSDNQFTGSLPSSLLSSSKLEVLDVAQNNFSGKLVIASRKICKLTTVSLSSNSFGSGEDDDELMKFIDGLSICKNLGLLDLSYNRMRGFLPDSLGNLSASLYHLSVSSNNIQGSLPPAICSLINLTHLGMSDNIFSGIIPNCLGNISPLSFLDVKSNLIEGPFPPSICSFNNLRYLDMSNNSFGGVIPQCFGNIMSSLEVIDLGNNFLRGTIPNVYKSCGRLEGFILNGNQLEGEVPSSLSKCPIETSSTTQLPFSSLRVLDLSHNGFKGHLPGKYFQNFNSMKNAPRKNSKPEYLTIRGMTYECENNPSSPYVKVVSEEEDEESRFTWKVVILGYGCGTFLGLVLGYLMLSTGRPKWFNANVDAMERMIHTRRNKRRYSDLELMPQGLLTLTIVKANNLKNMGMIRKSDPYVIAYIRLLEKFKRKVVDYNLNPVWNHVLQLIAEERRPNVLY